MIGLALTFWTLFLAYTLARLVKTGNAWFALTVALGVLNVALWAIDWRR